jgi:hypothetical protein
MPTTALAQTETRQMRLLSRILREKTGVDLPTFMASRRHPGLQWRTWEQITAELAEATGETLSREGVHRWSQRYGIPRSYQHDGPDYQKSYRDALAKRGIAVQVPAAS